MLKALRDRVDYRWRPQATTNWMLLKDKPCWTQFRCRTASCAVNIWITDVLSPPIEGLVFILRNNWLYRRTTATKFVLSWRSHQRWRNSSFRIPPILSQTFGVVEHGRKPIDLIEFINRCNLRMFKQQTFCFCRNQLPQFCIFWCSGRFTSSSPLVPCKAQSVALPVLKRVSFRVSSIPYSIMFMVYCPAIWRQLWFYRVLLWRLTRSLRVIPELCRWQSSSTFNVAKSLQTFVRQVASVLKILQQFAAVISCPASQGPSLYSLSSGKDFTIQNRDLNRTWGIHWWFQRISKKHHQASNSKSVYQREGAIADCWGAVELEMMLMLTRKGVPACVDNFLVTLGQGIPIFIGNSWEHHLQNILIFHCQVARGIHGKDTFSTASVQQFHLWNHRVPRDVQKLKTAVCLNMGHSPQKCPLHPITALWICWSTLDLGHTYIPSVAKVSPPSSLKMLSATLTFAQTHHCDITETILCCWEVANPSKAKGEN